MRFFGLLAITTVAAAAALVQGYEYSVFDTLPSVPDGWRQLPARIDPESKLSLRLHLHEQDWPELRKRLEAVSSPEHEDYGDHLSGADVQQLLRPSSSALNAVTAWLSSKDIEVSEIDYDYVKFTATISQAQDLLQAEYRYYKNEETGQKVLRTMQYSIPTELHDVVSLVQPTTMFGLRAHRSTIKPLIDPAESHQEATSALRTSSSSKEKKKVAASCNNTITLDCLADLYGFAGYNNTGKGSIGISGFLEQFAQWDDLTTFLTLFKPSIAPTANFSFIGIKNGNTTGLNTQNAPFDNIIEANLDIQYTVGISHPIPNTYFQTPGRPPYIPDLDVVENDSEPYLAYLESLLKLPQSKLPKVITTSYGESEQTVPLSYRKKVCNLFGALGGRGVSILFSSGDSGPGWSCRANDGSRAAKFLPVFPASCPWVTSVGGTINTDPEEVAVYFSSGGFSETWPAPWYQKSALKTYFSQHEAAWKPWAGYFNKAGRGFPDVAAQANNYQVVLDGNTYLIGGTSAAAPAFAAIVALANDRRLAMGKGKGTLGFLNPLLYQNPQAFTDVVAGRSSGCDGNRWGTPIPPGDVNGTLGAPAVIEGAGWDAVGGWDPVTGLGTPLFGVLAGL